MPLVAPPPPSIRIYIHIHPDSKLCAESTRGESERGFICLVLHIEPFFLVRVAALAYSWLYTPSLLPTIHSSYTHSSSIAPTEAAAIPSQKGFTSASAALYIYAKTPWNVGPTAYRVESGLWRDKMKLGHLRKHLKIAWWWGQRRDSANKTEIRISFHFANFCIECAGCIFLNQNLLDWIIFWVVLP